MVLYLSPVLNPMSFDGKQYARAGYTYKEPKRWRYLYLTGQQGPAIIHK